MQLVSRVQTWIFKDRLLPNPDGAHLASECGHLLTLVLEEILEASVTWMWSYHEVCYKPAPVHWIDCGWEQEYSWFTATVLDLHVLPFAWENNAKLQDRATKTLAGADQLTGDARGSLEALNT